MSPFNKILILGSARSGSTRILHLIRNVLDLEHGIIVPDQEVLNFRYYTELGLSVDERIKSITSNIETDFACVKCLWHQFGDATDASIKSLIDSYDRVIVTSRDNSLIEQVLSFAIAHTLFKMGSLRWNNLQTRDDPEPIVINEVSIKYFFEFYNRRQKIEKMLNGRNVIEIDYDFASSLSANDLLNFLEVPHNLSYLDTTVKLDTLKDKLHIIKNLDNVYEWIDKYR